MISEAVHHYIDHITDLDPNGDKIIIRASDMWYVYDRTRPLQFSEQIVRHIRDDGTPVIENILDNPLRGFPVLPPNMYRKLDLCKIAQHDLTDRGGCMEAQVFECAKKSVIAGRERSGNGQRSLGHREMKPVFKDHAEIEGHFDRIFADLYPGEAIDTDSEDEPKRPREPTHTSSGAGEKLASAPTCARSCAG